MADAPNHEEAEKLAALKRAELNLARCYLEVKAERDLMKPVVEAALVYEGTQESFAVLENAIAKYKAGINNAKGGS